VFVVIPVHNRRDLTLKCLYSLSLQTHPAILTIVVDDGSTDGTAEAISKDFPATIVLRGDGNLWWAGATNLGVKYVLGRAKRGDYILTLNNDTEVSPDYLSILADAANSHPQCLIGSVAVTSEDHQTIADGGVRIDWRTAKFTRLSRGKRYDSAIQENKSLVPVDVLSGRGTLIPVEVFRHIGPYDEVRLPHYGADYEFSHRAKKNGYELFVHYGAVVNSDVSATGLNNENRMLSWKELGKSFFSIRSPNSIRYRWNFARLTCPPLMLPSFFLFDMGRVVIGALRNSMATKSICVSST